MDMYEKLEILAEAAKYDASCSSSGSGRSSSEGRIGAATPSGCCHSFTADGRCVSLLKILMSNSCVYDCKYCVNRRSNDTTRASFSPEELAELTEVFSRVKKQAERMTTDSEEMENLNRSITGIATVYELQLRNISKQVSTIEQIDEQTRRMAQQIEELNNVYARMINALTINMNGVAGTPANEK